MTKKYKYAIADKIFAIFIVTLMIVLVITIPIALFCMGILLMFKKNIIILKGTGNIQYILLAAKFMLLTIIVLYIFSLIFNSLFQESSGMKKHITGFTLMCSTILLYKSLYSYFSINSLNAKLLIRKEGIFWVSIYLFSLYVFKEVTFRLIEKLYKKLILSKRK